jgi:signal transduction histidine kinase
MTAQDRAAALRSTSMPLHPVREDAPLSTASLDEQLLELFFDRTPMGIAVFDIDLRLRRCNRTWSSFFEHYLGVPAGHVALGKSIFELIPDNEGNLAPLIEAVRAGQVIRQAAHRLANETMETFWDVTFAPLYGNGQVVGMVDIVTDATDRVRAIECLEGRIAAFNTIAASMALDQPLAAMLAEVVGAVRRTTRAVSCAVVSWADEAAPLAAQEDGVFGAGYAEALRQAWSGTGLRGGIEADLPRIAMLRGFRRQGLAKPEFAPLHRFWQQAGWDDLAVVPLMSGGRAFGELHVHLRAGDELGSDDEAYLIALGDQAAVASQNAALFRATSQTAALVERQRLARELHDSVSQALFSMTLHGRAAERHLAAAGLDVDSPASQAVARLQELTQGALAEMRALIFELRPGALTEEGLAAALSKQAAALSAREQLPILVNAPATRIALDAGVEEQLYRIALEALNNAVKHAGATGLSVTVDASESERIVVTVADDGAGFDPSRRRPGHLGLGTMAERASAIGASLRIDSAPGRGTTVTVALPLETSAGVGLRHSAEDASA